MDFKNKIKDLPQSPGVYIFKDKSGKILYIGKASNLKNRVSSYFRRFLSDKTRAMVSQVFDIEYIKTFSETQALIQEAAMIKRALPKYNICLRDDKSFPLICVSQENFPRVYVCRSRPFYAKPGSYFGPYTNAKLLHKAIKIVRSVFGFRSCKKMPKKPCLYYRLGLCPAPCIGKISRHDYKEVINNISLFLEGNQDALLNKLVLGMNRLSQEKKYEEAAKVRDQINALAAIRREPKQEDYFKESGDLMHKLKLKKLPQRIEAFDISNISGQEACGSMVYFYNGRPQKNNYRRFKIKGVKGINDYAMLAEVVRRRYSRLKKENLPLPDLLLIDGGRQHLLTAQKEITGLGLEIPVISLAKERETIYILERKEPLALPFDSGALHLVQRLRDEAHRFALSYHHVLRRKKIIR